MKQKKIFSVYILASKKKGTIYIGVTSDIRRRLYEHKNDLIAGFTKKYKVHDLVYYESYEYISDALTREKQLKHWNRIWKVELIEKDNPKWQDLYEDLF